MDKRTSKTYDSNVGAKANTPLAKRLREEITDCNALAKYLGCSVQAVNQFKQGTSFPKVENIIRIADYYGISVDYLFGITNTRNRDTTIQAVCEYSGLTEENIRFLNRMRGSFIVRMANVLLDDARIQDGNANTLFKLIRFFLEYDGGNHPNRRINVHGDISDTPQNNTAARSDTIMLDEHIVENATLEEIKNRLLKLKEKRREEAANNGEL